MDVRQGAVEIVETLVKHGYIAYFAGGWVRDFLMGHPSSDIDIATDAAPEKILNLFPHTIKVGIAFGVVIVVKHGHQYEVSTFRKDLDYVNGRSPTGIQLSSPEEDALRRDFTINGMFYDPLKDQIYDYVHGYEDLKKGIIRTIGDPQERFFEDRLRMIRAIRFSARFGFPIDQETQDGIRENADTLFPAVAMERIWQEFSKMAAAHHFDHALIELHRLGLLPVIFPQLRDVHLKEIKQRVAAFPRLSKEIPPVVYLLGLFPDASLDELLEMCANLKISNQEMKLLEFVYRARSINDHPVDWVHFYANPWAQIAIRFWGAHQLDESTFCNQHDERQKVLHQHIQRLVQKKPLVSSGILKTEGVEPGVRMGQLLKEAETIAITQDLNDTQSVLEQLKQSHLWVAK